MYMYYEDVNWYMKTYTFYKVQKDNIRNSDRSSLYDAGEIAKCRKGVNMEESAHKTRAPSLKYRNTSRSTFCLLLTLDGYE